MIATQPTLTGQGAIVDVAEIIEQQPPGRILLRLVPVAWLVTFFDGFDMNSIAFVAPYLASDYSFDKSALSHIFAAGGAGTLFGGILFGALGDRVGRRRAIIAATALFGVLTLLMAASDRFWELLLLRFLNGFALGGALPLTWALSVEYVPTAYRATAVTLVMLGYGIGVSAAGPISVALIPHFGWQSVFVFGGIASLACAAVLLAVLPESLRYLAARAGGSQRLGDIARRLSRNSQHAAGARYIFSGALASDRRSWGPAPLFEGQTRWITPLLWLGYVASSVTTFFFTTWGPTVFEAVGLSRTTAAWTMSLNSLAGALGGIALMRVTDRLGPMSLAFMPAAAVPVLLTVGFAQVSQSVFVMMMCGLAVLLGGSHYGIISISGTFYPTAHRALGTGWMSGIGKLGSILAPWLGGLLLSSGMAAPRVFAILALCPAIFACCGFMLGRLERAGLARAAI
jgi:AAHS family 4-hydroxybenzoate transporter-like MFS transporter